MRPWTAPGVPVINVNNNCATGGTALYLAKLLVQGGQSECVLVVGFEKERLAARPPVPNPPAAPTTAAEPDNIHHIAVQMEAGSLAPKFPDRENPVERHFKEMARSVGGATKAPPTPQMFGNAAREHMSAPPPSIPSYPAHFFCMWTPPVLALLPPARFCWARPRACPAGAQRRGPRQAQVRQHRAAPRADRGQEPRARAAQPARAVARRALAGGRPEQPDDLRAAHEAAVLPDLRRGRGRGGLQCLLPRPAPGAPRERCAGTCPPRRGACGPSLSRARALWGFMSPL